MTNQVERGSLRGLAPSFGACADGPHLMSDAAKEAHQIGARIYSATMTEYIRDV